MSFHDAMTPEDLPRSHQGEPDDIYASEDYCQCGCGQITPMANRTDTAKGYVKGRRMRFCRYHGMKAKMSIRSYRTRYVPDHPRASPTGSVFEHVLIAERALGRMLPLSVQIHHVNRIKHDNRNTNLVICQDEGYHKLLHVRARVLRAGADPNTHRICGKCQVPLHIDRFSRDARRSGGCLGLSWRCRVCTATNRKSRKKV